MVNTFFDNIHTRRDLHLITVNVEVQPAEPKINIIDIPGADGSIDLTEAIGVGIKYKDREITWTFALYPCDDWARKRSEVSSILNGRRFNITFDDDLDYYYTGRLQVAEYSSDRLAHMITVRAVCAPYKLHKVAKKITKTVSPTEQTITLINDRMPVAPTIAATGGDIRVIIGTESAIFEAGTVRTDPAITLQPGINELKIKAMDSSATSIAFEWREGAL